MAALTSNGDEKRVGPVAECTVDGPCNDAQRLVLGVDGTPGEVELVAMCDVDKGRRKGGVDDGRDGWSGTHGAGRNGKGCRIVGGVVGHDSGWCRQEQDGC